MDTSSTDDNPYKIANAKIAPPIDDEFLSIRAELVFTQKHWVELLTRLRKTSFVYQLWSWIRWVIATCFGLIGCLSIVSPFVDRFDRKCRFYQKSSEASW